MTTTSNAMTLPVERIGDIDIIIEGEYGKGYYTSLYSSFNRSMNNDPFWDDEWEEEVGCFDTVDDARDEAHSRVEYLTGGWL